MIVLASWGISLGVTELAYSPTEQWDPQCGVIYFNGEHVTEFVGAVSYGLFPYEIMKHLRILDHVIKIDPPPARGPWPDLLN